MKLELPDIVDTALRLLDEQGLDALSMRTVAGALGVRASALYWHVGDKEELLALMALHFYGGALAAVPPALQWRDWLLAFGHALRRALLAHRDSARLLATARPVQEDAQERADWLAAPLVAQGLSRAAALSCQASVISLALGWSIYEQSDAMHAYLAKMIGFDESFSAGLAAMVGGFPEPAAPRRGARSGAAATRRPRR